MIIIPIIVGVSFEIEPLMVDMRVTANPIYQVLVLHSTQAGAKFFDVCTVYWFPLRFEQTLIISKS